MIDRRATNRGPSAASENRASLIAAAREMLSESGFDVPLSAIARRAGVGQGSLYRHFPDRIALAFAVFEENIDRLAELADRPGTTFDDLLAAVGDQAAASSAFMTMLSAARDDARVRALGDRVTAILAGRLLASKRAGEVADWVEPADLMMAVAMLGGVVGLEVPDRRARTAERARRLIAGGFKPSGVEGRR